MDVLARAAENAAAEDNKEGHEVKIKDPVKEGVDEDKKRKFMQPIRPHNKIWNFEIEDDEEKIEHVLRPGADPRLCYIDGRVERLLECISKIAANLKVHNKNMWDILETYTLEIFYAKEKEYGTIMKNY